ncbi:putative nicotine oxidoreductase [Dermacentor variabilis]|uniref:putative nicotine oxidoreductase n=1 Tax=Dermacentor variabilis TaxID=34621 RepID=UPI003F5B6DEB
MFGFRANLSTQDVLLQIKEEILNKIPKAGGNVIMALDVKGAFDNVSHGAIMEGLNKTNCGKRVHDYVREFLSKRTATVGLGDLRSDTFDTPNKGTPQGSVISPILFNIAMIGLAQKLNEIEGIQHAMYADDIMSSKRCGHTLGLLKQSTEQVSRIITRVSQRGSGMKEGDTIKLVKSLVVSRVTYSLL